MLNSIIICFICLKIFFLFVAVFPVTVFLQLRLLSVKVWFYAPSLHAMIKADRPQTISWRIIWKYVLFVCEFQRNILVEVKLLIHKTIKHQFLLTAATHCTSRLAVCLSDLFCSPGASTFFTTSWVTRKIASWARCSELSVRSQLGETGSTQWTMILKSWI